jgi:hypothetical protein
MPRVDFAPFLLDEGVVIGEEPTAGQLAVARQIDELNRGTGFMYLVFIPPCAPLGTGGGQGEAGHLCSVHVDSPWPKSHWKRKTLSANSST